MRVVLTDGSEIPCKNFTATESGVLLTKDKKRKKVFGFVATHELKYVLPDDVEPVRPADENETVDEAEATDDGEHGGSDTPDVDREKRDESAGGELVIRAPETAEKAEGDNGDADAEAWKAQTAEETDPKDEAPAAETVDADDSREDIRQLGGLGSTYAERLRGAGYESLSDLVNAEPAAVAEAASVAPGRAHRWITAAERMTTPPEDGGEGGEGEDGGDEEVEPEA